MKQMNPVNKTLYIPLAGKAYVSRKGLFLKDQKAEEIWTEAGFALRGKSKSKWLAYYMGIRSAVFDEWTQQQMADTQNAAVIHIGCGMDSRILRTGSMNHMWYDLDFPEVIAERKRYYLESAGYQMLAGDVRSSGWLKCIPESKHAIVVMEGVSMYLPLQDLCNLIANLCRHFERISLLMDCYSVAAAKISKYKNPVNDVGVTKVYGIDHPVLLQQDDFVFIKEHNMTPDKYVDQLQGIERYIFKKLYAGSLSGKLYRLFEYKKP